ncbi:hypothetical protein [Deinococcus multiflagellatus]|uniref:Uncharacterized protein n=1 Tax=Deinococcus multiflagellatus TaxID=1656887 RepID=A0ABW1ZJQ0_9DEIO
MLTAALCGGALAATALKPFSLDIENASGSEKYTVSGQAPASYKADNFFGNLEDATRKITMKFRAASTLVTYDVAAPRKVLRSVKTATRQLLVVDTQGNNSFSDRYHLGMTVSAKGVPGRFVFCEASTNTLGLITEAIAICDSLSLKKK